MIGELIEVISWIKAPVMWLSSSANRQRLRGARVEIVALLLTREPVPSIFMVQSAYDDCWMPPQEGVNYREQLRSALIRCLSEECSVRLVDSSGIFLPGFYLRDIKFLTILELPRDRWGERSVAGGVDDSLLVRIELKRKAYWLAFVVVADQKLVSPVPNVTEIRDAGWVELGDAIQQVSSNRPEKAALLERAIRLGAQHLLGASKAESYFDGPLWSESRAPMVLLEFGS